MATSDLVQLLNMVGAVLSHPALPPDGLKGAQSQIKDFLADKTWLQDPEILTPLDRVLKYGTAGQVPASFIGAPFNLADYVDPKPEKPEKPEKPNEQAAKPHAPEKHH